MTISPANISGTRIVEAAESISCPIPEFDAASSDTTDPTKASVIAILSEAKKSGIERGSPTLRSTSAREAPRARSTSSSSGSIVASPVAMFTVIGKKQIRNAVSVAGTTPIPNQTTRIGTNAAFGIALNATSSGYSPLYMKRDDPMITPRRTPTTMPSPKPTIVVQNVGHVLYMIGPKLL